MALRLHDLPPGYVPLPIGPEGSGIEFACEGIDPTDPSRKLARYVKRFDPVGCLGIYVRAYLVPGPAPTPSVAGTGALRSNTLAGALAGFDAAGELLAKLVEEEGDLEEVAAPGFIGEATRLFHWQQIPTTYLRNDRSGSFLVWRTGRVVSAAFAAAPTLTDSDQIALELAQRQQAHVEHPTVYKEAERDYSEVWLDNPAVQFPVRWLGHDFTPGHELPPARLLTSYVRPGTHSSGVQMQLDYSHGIEIKGWTKTGWKHFMGNKKMHELRAEPCLDSTEVPGFDRGAIIFAGHVRGFRPCAPQAPVRYFAFVFFEDAVLTINFPGCPDCNPHSPYSSLKAIKAIVRGLELRPKPVF